MTSVRIKAIDRALTAALGYIRRNRLVDAAEAVEEALVGLDRLPVPQGRPKGRKAKTNATPKPDTATATPVARAPQVP